MRAHGLVAHDERVGLGAVNEAERDAGIGGVEERALPLHQVPMIGFVVGRDPLDGAGDEIRHHRVDGDAVAGDEDAGPAGGAEIGLQAARPHLLLECERRVHLADRTIGADREHALAAALPAVADGEIAGGMADIDQLPSVLIGGAS